MVMNELLGILGKLKIKSASVIYGKFKPGGATLELKKGMIDISISGSTAELESKIGSVIAEKIETYPTEIYFCIGKDEVYYADLQSREISVRGMCTSKGIQKVKKAIDPYPNWTFKE